MKKKNEQPGGWLFKEEPSHYSFADLEKDGVTDWDGVDNNLARNNLRSVRAGDRVLYYHTGTERAIVGEMRALTGPLVDSVCCDPKAVMVRVKVVRRWPASVTLQAIKDDALLKKWDLVRLPRLSVVPVNSEQWQRLEELGLDLERQRKLLK